VPEDEDEEFEKFTKDVSLRLAYDALDRWGAPSRSEPDKDKILKSLFVSRAEYEQYASDIREREAREQKEAEARAIAYQAQLENDPKYWKRMYEDVVKREKDREEERETNRQMWVGAAIVFAAFAALGWLLERLGM
jgi:hypothetical protein